MFICAVYILGRHLDGALHRGANRENFLSSFGSGIAESVQWFAQIGFHLNNFIAAQVSPVLLCTRRFSSRVLLW